MRFLLTVPYGLKMLSSSPLGSPACGKNVCFLHKIILAPKLWLSSQLLTFYQKTSVTWPLQNSRWPLGVPSENVTRVCLDVNDWASDKGKALLSMNYSINFLGLP